MLRMYHVFIEYHTNHRERPGLGKCISARESEILARKGDNCLLSVIDCQLWSILFRRWRTGLGSM